MIRKLKEILTKRWARSMDDTDITMEQLKEKMEKGAIIIDVRSPQEYGEGHIEGAILLPEYDINSTVQEKLNNKEQEIVLYCSSGIRSKKALKKLEKMGYKHVYNLYQGWDNWGRFLLYPR